jgi:hypothetical protein
MSDDPEIRDEGFYWVVLGHNPAEIAYWERGGWWLAGDDKPWQPDAVKAVGSRLTPPPQTTEGIHEQPKLITR